MDILSELKAELKSEYEVTKKFFESFPEGKNDYAPHEKSMKLMFLATHISETFAWPKYIITTSELDFGKGDYKMPQIATKAELLQRLDDDFKAGLEGLEAAKEDQLSQHWAIKNNGQTLMEWSKYFALRHALSQAIHHRAQLGVYYRLNAITLPESYGPSADTVF